MILSLFKKTISTDEAKAELEKAAMRRALYQWLWEQTHPAKPSSVTGKMIPARPCPSLEDEQIRKRLKELLR